MKDYLKYLPAVLIVSALVGTNAVSTYKLDKLSEQMGDVQKLMSDLVVKQAVDDIRIKNMEK